jgi:hypothetical protein
MRKRNIRTEKRHDVLVIKRETERREGEIRHGVQVLLMIFIFPLTLAVRKQRLLEEGELH